MGEPPDGRFAGWVEDGQAVVVGGGQAVNGLFKRLVGTKLGHSVDESSGALARGARHRLFDVKGGDDAEQRAVGVRSCRPPWLRCSRARTRRASA